VRRMAPPRRRSARSYGAPDSRAGAHACRRHPGAGHPSPAQARYCRAPRCPPPNNGHRCRAAQVRGFSPATGGDELPQHPLLTCSSTHKTSRSRWAGIIRCRPRRLGPVPTERGHGTAVHAHLPGQPGHSPTVSRLVRSLPAAIRHPTAGPIDLRPARHVPAESCSVTGPGPRRS
jgi:hypothetical protein